MSRCYIDATCTWPTDVTGAYVPHDAIDEARFVQLLNERLNEGAALNYLDNHSLGVSEAAAAYAEAHDLDDAPEGSDLQRKYALDSFRAELTAGWVALDDEPLTIVFDGLRHWAISGGYSHGDVPTDEFDVVVQLAESGIFDKPVDGEEFHDTYAIQAALALADKIVTNVRVALLAADLSPHAMAAAEQALRAVNIDTIGNAKTLRRVLTRRHQDTR